MTKKNFTIQENKSLTEEQTDLISYQQGLWQKHQII